MKKVSVIVPIYNVEKYIYDCLKSVAAQTYQNIECILVDDCGTDSSISIADQFVEANRGNVDFKKLRHKKNKGLSAARNTGIDAASGEYLYFLDSDDYIAPDCIERLVGLSEKLSVDMAIASALEIREDENGPTGETCPWISSMPAGVKILQPEITERKVMRPYEVICVTAWNKLVKTSFLKENGLYFENGLLHEDELWSFMWALKAASIAYDDKITYYYRRRPGALTNAYTLKNVDTMLGIFEMCEKYAGAELGNNASNPLSIMVSACCERKIDSAPIPYLKYGISKAYGVYKEHLNGRKSSFPAEIAQSLPLPRRVLIFHRRLPAPVGFAIWALTALAKKCVAKLCRLFKSK